MRLRILGIGGCGLSERRDGLVWIAGLKHVPERHPRALMSGCTIRRWRELGGGTQIVLGVLWRAFRQCQAKIQVRLKYIWFRFHGLLVCRNRILFTSEGMIDITQVVPGGVLPRIGFDHLLQQWLSSGVIVLRDGIFRLRELGKSWVLFLYPMMAHRHVLRLARGGGRLGYAPLPDSGDTGYEENTGEQSCIRNQCDRPADLSSLDGA